MLKATGEREGARLVKKGLVRYKDESRGKAEAVSFASSEMFMNISE